MVSLVQIETDARVQNPAYRPTTFLLNNITMTDDSRKKKRIYDEDKEKPNFIQRIQMKIREWIHFLTYDIWRLNPENFSGKKNLFHNILKVIMLTVRGVQEQDLSSSSRSLTYRTILSIVPMLAVIFAIARGFGFENIVQSQIFEFFNSEVEVSAPVSMEPIVTDSIYGIENDLISSLPPMASSSSIPSSEDLIKDTTSFTLETLIDFVNNSLEHAKGGVFAGIGVVLLLYTIVLLFSDIENSFNRIWGIKKGRPIQRRVIDYFALMLLLPIFVVLNYSITVILQASTDSLDQFTHIITPLMGQLINMLPFLVMIISMTLLYKFMPNLKVKFMSALAGGIVGGIALQVFQIFYLEGQLWISKYNAIYGAFAALPLLLLWVQLSWFIVLIGAEISFATQNVQQFSFDRETKNITRRYRDFFTIIISSVIVKRFAQARSPLTASQLSMKCKVPIKLTIEILDELIKLDMILPTPKLDDDRVMAYQPAFDVNQMSVGSLLDLLDRNGTEDFNVDDKGEFTPHWDALMESRMSSYEKSKDVMLMDL